MKEGERRHFFESEVLGQKVAKITKPWCLEKQRYLPMFGTYWKLFDRFPALTFQPHRALWEGLKNVIDAPLNSYPVFYKRTLSNMTTTHADGVRFWGNLCPPWYFLEQHNAAMFSSFPFTYVTCILYYSLFSIHIWNEIEFRNF